MHPEILRQLTAQRGRDLRRRAERAHLARTASRGRRALRHHAQAVDEFAAPAIPDYVDGSFRGVQAEEPRAQVPAARHAA
jgi:hypothetical protein